MNLGPLAARSGSEREYAEMVDETVVFPVLRAARALLVREGADASHLDWVPDGIWPVVPVEPAPNPWRYGGIDPTWLTGGVPAFSTAVPPPMRVREYPLIDGRTALILERKQ